MGKQDCITYGQLRKWYKLWKKSELRKMIQDEGDVYSEKDTK